MHAEASSSRDIPAITLSEILHALPGLQPLARLWARDDEKAADLLQDTVERALRGAASYRAGTNAGAWMRSIMYHLAIDDTRRQKRDRRLREYYLQAERAVNVPPPDEPEAPPPPPVAGLDQVRQAAERLREPLRGTFLLWLEERLTYKEISRRQHIPSNTVATRLLRARRQVRRITAFAYPAAVPGPCGLG